MGDDDGNKPSSNQRMRRIATAALVLNHLSQSSSSSEKSGNSVPNAASRSFIQSGTNTNNSNSGIKPTSGNVPPACLSKVLGKIAEEEKLLTRSFDYDKRRMVNEKLLHPLILTGIDMEELAANQSLHQQQQTSDKIKRVQDNTLRHNYNLQGKSKNQITPELLNFQFEFSIRAKTPKTPQMTQSFDRTHNDKVKQLIQEYEEKLVQQAKEHRRKQKELAKEREREQQKLESHHKNVQHGKDKQNQDDENASVNSRLSLQGVKERKRRKQLFNLDNEFIPMKQETARKYFGEEARVHFFDLYQKMSQQSKLLAPHGSNSSYLALENDTEENLDDEDEEIDEKIISANANRASSAKSTNETAASKNEKGFTRRLIEDESLAHAFSWSRLIDEDTEESQSNIHKSRVRGRDSINLSSLDGNNSALAASASDSLLLSRSNGFYDDLQAISSNDHLKQSIDRDLLSVPSFGLYDKNNETTNNDYDNLSVGEQRVNTRMNNQIKQMHSKKVCLTPLDLKRSRLARQQNQQKLIPGSGLEQSSFLSTDSQPNNTNKQSSIRRASNSSQSVGSQNSGSVNNDSNTRQKRPSNDDNESVASNASNSQQNRHGNHTTGIAMTEKKQHHHHKHINLHHLAADLQSKSSLITVASRPISARTKYIAGCLREGLKPLPNVIIRKDFTTVLDLSHYLMGDEMGKILAECLADIPHIESIDLNDNLLMDPSLSPLISTISTMSSLRSLNLSRNKIDGDSSDALAEFVSRSDCPLTSLILQNADVDDDEADRFVQCLVSNGRLQELDLSSNLLGTAEPQSDTSNTEPAMTSEKSGKSKKKEVVEEVRTGGIAIAEFIRSEKCQLKVLKLAWNSIHGLSAEKLAMSLAVNHTLTYLDLSNNGLGYKAGELLGDAIMDNRTLRTLLISGNNLTATSTVCICMGVVENQALHRVEMNENPVGEAGVKMIMQVSFNIGPRIHLHAKNCNINAHDSRCFYDPAHPMGDYTLRLSLPFDRAVAFHLLYIAATHASYIFQTATYELGKMSRNLKFIQIIAKDREQYFDSEQKKIIEGLRLLHSAASNTKLATKLFYEADEDHSGKLDKEELQAVLDKIGFSIDEDRLNDILAVFDVDGAGTIDLQEFISLLKSQQREAAMRIKDMIEYPILALTSEPTVKYIPPKKGILKLSLVDGFVQKNKFYTLSAVDQRYAHNMARDIIGDASVVVEAVRHNRLRYDEAINTFKVIFQEQGDKAKTLMKILPQMMFPSESRQLVSKVTNDNRLEIARIKMAFGVTLRPMLGAYNGYYCLDLSKELHRICLSKLLLQSQTLNHGRQQNSFLENSKVGDVSQHGNWSCFRNEVFNGEHFIVTPQKFTPMPESGILSFDFSGSNRPTGSELKLTDKRLCKVLQNLCLLPIERTSEAMYKLTHWKKKTSEMSRDNKLFMPAYQFTVEKAIEVSTYMDEFYEHVLEREDLIKRGMKKEEMSALEQKDDEEVHNTNHAADDSSDDERNESNNQSAEVSATNSVDGDNDDNNDNDNDNDNETYATTIDDETVSSKTKTKQKFGIADNLGKDTISKENTKSLSVIEQRKRKIAEQKRRLQKLLFSTNHKHKISVQAKARRLIEAIDETFCQLWIYSRHLALILVLFQQLLGTPARSKYFGSYCAEIVVDLFSRVVDLHNFEVVLEVLSARDCAAVYCRLGMLNLFNPMKPEVTMELQIGRREERVVTKMIVYLSIIEPGLNLIFKQFRWKREMDIIPGWDVTEPWCTESGLSPHGYFAFTYYSGEGKNKAGCMPDIFLRKALTALVLIDENEIIPEDEVITDDPVNTGQLHFNQNKDIWIGYLAL